MFLLLQKTSRAKQGGGEELFSVFPSNGRKLFILTSRARFKQIEHFSSLLSSYTFLPLTQHTIF